MLIDILIHSCFSERKIDMLDGLTIVAIEGTQVRIRCQMEYSEDIPFVYWYLNDTVSFLNNTQSTFLIAVYR